eukprot:gene25381-11042_t
MALFHRELLPPESPLQLDELRQQAITIAAHMVETHSKLSSDEECLFEYARFLLLKTWMKDGSMPAMLAPSGIVKEVWHAHMLHPHLYMRLCEQLGMGDIAHDPDTATDIGGHKKRLARTTTLYAALFGEEAGRLWHEDAGRELVSLPAVKLEAGIATHRGDEITRRLLGSVTAKAAQTKMDVCGEEELWVVVVTITGKIVTVYAPALGTIDLLKSRIQDRQGIPPDQQIIYFVGKEREDGKTLGDYNIVNEARVHLVTKFKGC